MPFLYILLITMISKTIWLLWVVFAVTNGQKFMKEVVAGQADDVCLDGQPAFAYFSQSQPQYQRNIFVYFMQTPSASFCGNPTLLQTLQSCIALQSEITSYWSSSLEINSGILAKLDSKQWLKVVIPHCDGGLFQGYSKNPTKYKNKDLYFRGNSIVKSALKNITERAKGTSNYQIVMAGTGLGAIGAMIWVRYYKDYTSFLNIQNFRLILDSIPQNYLSIKSNTNQYQASLQNMMKLANTDQNHPFSLCALRQDNEENCFFLDYGYKYFNFPTMVVESQYDTYTLNKILEISCVDQKGSLSGCSSAQIATMRMIKLFQMANMNDNSYWSISCSASNFLTINYQSQKYSIKDTQVYQSVQNFIDMSRSNDLDQYSWPSNSQCSGG